MGVKRHQTVKLTFAQQAALDLERLDNLKPDMNFQSRLKKSWNASKFSSFSEQVTVVFFLILQGKYWVNTIVEE